MRRRTALAAVLASGALAGVVGCSFSGGDSSTAPTPSAPPAPSTSLPPLPAPPSPTSCPSGFSPQVRWPTASVSSAITAVHEHYLAGTAVVHDELLPETTGPRPVVVDLEGPTTWAVLLDEDGALTTKEVELGQAPKGSPSALPGADVPYTVLRAGPAVMDSTSAYLVVAAVELTSPEDTVPGSQPCPVSLVKVRLADGTLEATARVSESLPLDDVCEVAPRSPLQASLRRLLVSLSQDRASILLAADPSSTSCQPVGLRLAASDLSVTLDLDTLMSRAYPSGTSLPPGIHGEAVTLPRNSSSVFSLADGQETLLEEGAVFLAWNGWLYCTSSTTSSTGCYALQPASGQTVALETAEGAGLRSAAHWPGICSDQRQLLITDDDAFYFLDPPSTTTTAPGWEKERAVPRAACVFGDVLYTAPPAGSGEAAPTRVEMTSVATGEALGEAAEVGADWPISVTAWGLASGGSFFPATGWLDEAAPEAEQEEPGQTSPEQAG